MNQDIHPHIHINCVYHNSCITRDQWGGLISRVKQKKASLLSERSYFI